MKNKKLLYGLFVILVAVVVGLLVLGTPSPATEGKIVISYSGGNAMLAQECMDNSFITETADYIIEGSVEKVGSGLWEGGRIFTYTDLVIEKYVKGIPLEEDRLLIKTSGGCVGLICERVEDQPIFHEGKTVRIYFEKSTIIDAPAPFSIVCASGGIEEIG